MFKAALLSGMVVSAALGAGIAQAADIPVKAPVVRAPVSLYDWTGFYVGLHAGAGWARTRWVDVTAPPPLDEGTHRADGWLLGGQLGYNLQMGAWVIGLEADASWADISGDSISLAFPEDRDFTEISALGTVAGRLGYAQENLLIFVKGGAAVVRGEFTAVDIPSGLAFTNWSDTRWGWMVGAGVEYGFAPNWTTKLEYNYMDFGTERTNDIVCDPPPGAIDFCTTIDEEITQHVHVVKLGINYRFAGR